MQIIFGEEYLQFDLDAVGVVAEGAVEDLGELGRRLLDDDFARLLSGHLDEF